MQVSGPYKYEGDVHPSFRIDGDDRLIAVVFASDGNIDAAETTANRIADALSLSPPSCRLPTFAEAKAAVSLLYRCNGHDLSTWTDGIWPSDDLSEAFKALRKQV